MDPAKQIDLLELMKPIKTELNDKDVDILVTLSDNKGYAESELAMIIGKYQSNVNSLIDGLSSHKFGDLEDSILIRYYHLKDPIFLLHKIQDQRDPISEYIFKNMLGIFDKEYPAYSDGGAMGWDLSLVLDPLLFDKNLYNRERFADVKLSEDAKKLLALKEKLVGMNIRILNRILLEDAYPDEICKTRISLIHQVWRVNSNESKRPYFINSDLRTFHIIVDHLSRKILLDRSRLAEHRTNESLNLWKFESILIKRPKQKKEIKAEIYEKRLEKNSQRLSTFMTSDYVGELIKKFGHSVLLRVTLPWCGCKYQEILKVLSEKGYISLEDTNRLKEAFSKNLSPCNH